MKVLIIEDDGLKFKHLKKYMDETFPITKIEWKKSYQSGLDDLLTNSYDLILLDMSMHIYEESNSEGGGNFETYAGKMLLQEIELYNIVTKVVVVTGYDVYGDGTTLGSLKEELRKDHGQYYLGTVYFVSKEENWKKELYSLIKTSFNGEN